jgi:hypothetical protein
MIASCYPTPVSASTRTSDEALNAVWNVCRHALKYCRLRSIDSNWHRIERQRTAIQAAMDRAKSLSLKELDALADVVLPLIHTNLTKEQISDLLLHANKYLGATAEQMTVPLRVPGQPARCDFQFEAERIRELIYGPEG